MSVIVFVRLQLILFGILIAFWISLAVPFIGVKIPIGLEGEWFNKLFDIIMAVSNIASLAMIVKVSDEKIIPWGGKDEKVDPTDKSATDK